MKYKLISVLIIFLISSILVFASDNAPPPIPTEYWGQVSFFGTPVPDGLAVTAEVSSVDYAQASQTSGGYYNVILINGDRELTYETDPDCSIHNASGEACVPCDLGTPGDCVEGPQDGEIVKIKINSTDIMPATDWQEGLSEEVDIITPIGDWDESGCVDMGDFVGPFADNYGSICTMTHPLPLCLMYDLVLDGVIDMGDFVGPFADNYGEGC